MSQVFRMAVMKNISWLLKWTESWEDQHQGEVVPKSVYWPPNHIQHWLLKQHSAQEQSLNSKFWKFRGLKEDKSIYSQSSENPLNNRGVFDSSFSNLENWFLYGCLSTTFRGGVASDGSDPSTAQRNTSEPARSWFRSWPCDPRQAPQCLRPLSSWDFG